MKGLPQVVVARDVDDVCDLLDLHTLGLRFLSHEFRVLFNLLWRLVENALR